MKQVIAQIYIEDNKPKKAENILLELVKDNQTLDFNPHILLLELYQKTRHFKKAENICTVYLKEEKEFGKSKFYTSCAWIYLIQEKYNSAEQYFKQAKQQNEKDMQTNMQYFEGNEDFINSMKKLSKIEWLQNMLVLEWKRGNMKLAKDYLQQLKLLDSDNNDTNLNQRLEELMKRKNPSIKTKLIIKAFNDLLPKTE
ncbi:MAG TPA: hypothetical protein ENI82_05545 [Bacteroidetes bacterium]|nr:hypothetical protein [Bacteroidota bacterium]